MSWFIIAGIAVVGIIWIVGSFHALSDLLDNGKSLKEYREKYGKDLGFLVCATHRGLWFTVWPIVGLVSFGFGLVKDVVNFIFKNVLG